MHWIDPECLPEVSGVLDCFLLNADGEADGFVLADGTEVHFPPHMGGAVLATAKPGGAVRIRGVRPRGVAMIAAVAVTPEAGGCIVDNGPPDENTARKAARKQAHAGRSAMEVEGVLRQVLHGHKGEVRGLLLEDGRAGRFPPQTAEALVPLLEPGSRLLLRGDGFTTEHGTVIAIREIGTSPEGVRRIEAKPAKDKPRKPDQSNVELDPAQMAESAA
jgi:hypothetical protein